MYRILLFPVMLFFCTTAMAQKSDLIYLHNGDRITGEIKGLRRGKLELNTDHMGTLNIEWDEITKITNGTGQVIELVDGSQYYGTLVKTAEDSNSTLAIDTEEGVVEVGILDIIYMQPVEAGIWNRLDFSVDLGFSWDKASNVGRYNLGADVVYRRRKSLMRAGLSSELTTQQNRDDTSRSVLNAAKVIYMPNKRYKVYFGNLEHNDELGIGLRTLFGAGYGWIPIRSQQSNFILGGGLAINNEIPQDGNSEANLEAVAMFHYEYYKYSNPKRSLNVDLKLYPSLTDFGRIRSGFDINFEFDLVADMFWKLQLYASYDSAPISEKASSSDYGIISSVGYKF